MDNNRLLKERAKGASEFDKIVSNIAIGLVTGFYTAGLLTALAAFILGV